MFGDAYYLMGETYLRQGKKQGSLRDMEEDPFISSRFDNSTDRQRTTQSPS